MRKYLTEFIGTTFFAMTIGLAVMSGSPFAPLVIGCALMVIVYMGGHVSGGHYNPAVSFAAYRRGALPASDLLPYVIAQVAGATLGAYFAYMFLDQTFAPMPASTATTMTAFLVETLYTFLLALTVLNVATSKRTQGNSYFGLAIGFVIVIAAFAGGPISGGAFNPAIGTGPTIVHALLGGGGWSHLWLYWAGPLLGGLLASVVFKIQEEA
ncbi:MAG: porin [Gemmatimonadales bacterium]|nr:porin [Gemmatimonadales bacterium]